MSTNPTTCTNNNLHQQLHNIWTSLQSAVANEQQIYVAIEEETTTLQAPSQYNQNAASTKSL